MKDNLLLGVSRYLLPIPRFIWQRQVRGDANLNFMSVDHHRVRDFVVTEIPKPGNLCHPATSHRR